VTTSCNDMSRLVEGRHLLRKIELGTKDRTLEIDKTASATRTRKDVGSIFLLRLSVVVVDLNR
jgi:hypothetical protein